MLAVLRLRRLPCEPRGIPRRAADESSIQFRSQRHHKGRVRSGSFYDLRLRLAILSTVLMAQQQAVATSPTRWIA